MDFSRDFCKSTPRVFCVTSDQEIVCEHVHDPKGPNGKAETSNPKWPIERPSEIVSHDHTRLDGKQAMVAYTSLKLPIDPWYSLQLSAIDER